MWYLNEDREMLQKAFRDYAQKRVRPLAQGLEDETAQARDALLEMGRLGMFTMPMAPEFGGTGPDYTAFYQNVDRFFR